jgi:hypothetical protein
MGVAPAGLAEINLINCPLIRKAIYYYLINELAGLVWHIIELSSLKAAYTSSLRPHTRVSLESSPLLRPHTLVA